jgi:S-DNA-T family DNA segregation ATPase FtsK/SpoIIIE
MMRLTSTLNLEFLPDGVRLFLRHRLEELAGFALLVLVLAGALALFSFSLDDPSLNNATPADSRNLLGAPGAIIADLLLQSAGLASLLLLLIPAALAVRLIAVYDISHVKLRLGAGLMAVLLGALSARLFFPPFDANLLAEAEGLQTLPAGPGGALGHIAAAFLPDALNRPQSPGGMLIGLLSAFIMLRMLFYAMALKPRWLTYFALIGFGVLRSLAAGIGRLLRASPPRERDEPAMSGLARLREEISIWFGYIAHTRLSLRARFSRGASKSGRREPILSRRSATRRQSAEDESRNENGGDDDHDARSLRVTRKAPSLKPGRRAAEEAQPLFDFAAERSYMLPTLNLLTAPRARGQEMLSDEALEQNARLLESVLEDFGIRGDIINVRPGPVVTLYELEPAPGIKSSRVVSLADDIARSMSAVSARVAVVPGRNVIGIELPNARRELVFLRELLSSRDFEDPGLRLGLALGKAIGGEPMISDLTRMPHLLIAGTTGSGKSVGINTMILSLLYRHSPQQCRLILIDPKMLELSVYEGIPHLLAPVVTEPKKAIIALKWVVREMEDRYRRMAKLGVRNIDGFNERLAEAARSGEVLSRRVQTGFDRQTGEPVFEEEELHLEPLPFIVVVIDEMADLMMIAGKDIEAAVQRLAQMARAAGIHLIAATQRPSVDVITGVIKANFPTRISFQVTSKIDSRTILGDQGAEQLLGQGDMLFMAAGGRIRRVHGPFVSDEEVERVVRHLKKQGVPEYLEAVTQFEDDNAETDIFGMLNAAAGDAEDELYDKAVAIVARDRKVSTSYIQRRLQIGYNRAARLVERMEEDGVISQANHAGKRDVLVDEH